MSQQEKRGSVARAAATLLVVDNERAVRIACAAMARSLGLAPLLAAAAAEGLAILQRTPVDIVLTDLHLSDMNGLEFLDLVCQAHAGIFVVVMSDGGTIESAVDAMKRGACDFLSKPFSPDTLRAVLQRIVGQLTRNEQAERLREELDRVGGFPLLIGRSPAMQQAYRVVMRAAATASPVLLLGEAGTAKQRLARAIHRSTQAPEHSFVVVDCSLPEGLENELLGDKKNAAAEGERDVAGGTIFLDEVAALSLEAQARLMHFLQERSSSTPTPWARLIAASSRDLAQEVGAGRFRQDLYYRLSILVVRLQPLRERRDDIVPLAEYFLRQLIDQYGVGKTFSAEALLQLAAFDWPGNAEELEAAVERAYMLTSGRVIGAACLPQPAEASRRKAVPTIAMPVSLRLDEIERVSVLRAIEDSGGDKKKAAQRLGISRTTLYRKLNEYKLSG